MVVCCTGLVAALAAALPAVVASSALAGPQTPTGAEATFLKSQRLGFNDNFDAEGYEPPFTPNVPQMDWMLGFATDGGADVIRFPFDWCRLSRDREHPTQYRVHPKEWNWSTYDALFDQIRELKASRPDREDVAVILSLQDSPPWANGQATYGGCTPGVLPEGPGQPEDGAIAAPPTDISAWRMFVDAALERYARNIDNGIVAVEAWNEPNLQTYWGTSDADDFVDDPRRYARLVATASSVVREFERDFRVADLAVLTAGLAPGGKNPQRFLEQLFDPAIGNLDPDAVDGIGLHLYANRTTPADTVSSLKEGWDEVDRGLRGTGAQRKPRWITEIGVPVNPNDDGPNGSYDSSVPAALDGEPNQAEALVSAYQLFFGKLNARSFVVHSLIASPWSVIDGPYGNVLRCRPSYGGLAATQNDSIDPLSLCQS